MEDLYILETWPGLRAGTRVFVLPCIFAAEVQRSEKLKSWR
jgi:hypothetical protein